MLQLIAAILLFRPVEYTSFMFDMFRNKSPAEDLKSSTVQYRLQRSQRRKTIEIQIHRDGVKVLAPSGTSLARIDHFVASKEPWIEQKLSSFEELTPLLHEQPLIDGSLLLYLGHRYPLQILESCAESGVNIHNGVITVSLSRRIRRPKEEAVRTTLEKWYRQQAEDYLRRMTDHWASVMEERYVAVSVRSYRRKWGCCNSRRELSYNWLLIMAPVSVIEYVVVHELSHLQQMNHSAKFWRRVEQFCPEFTKAKRWLNENGKQLIW